MDQGLPIRWLDGINLLPIYAEHILYRTLNEECFITEVLEGKKALSKALAVAGSALGLLFKISRDFKEGAASAPRAASTVAIEVASRHAPLRSGSPGGAAPVLFGWSTGDECVWLMLIKMASDGT